MPLPSGCRYAVLLQVFTGPWSPDSSSWLKITLLLSTWPPPKPSLTLIPARGPSYSTLCSKRTLWLTAMKRADVCFPYTPITPKWFLAIVMLRGYVNGALEPSNGVADGRRPTLTTPESPVFRKSESVMLESWTMPSSATALPPHCAKVEPRTATRSALCKLTAPSGSTDQSPAEGTA